MTEDTSTVSISFASESRHLSSAASVQESGIHLARMGTSDRSDDRVQEIRFSTFRVPRSKREDSQPPVAADKRVLRRMRGVMLQKEGSETSVLFYVDGTVLNYFLPSDQLHKNGVTEENQPFEMDEVELTMEDGAIVTGYTFRPLASPADKFIDPLELSPERQERLHRILKKHKK